MRLRKPRLPRSALWTCFLLPLTFLPYRWLWLPCGLAAMLITMPSPVSLPDRVRRDHTLILGSVLMLLLRTGLDPAWWFPWILFFALVAWARDRSWFTAKVSITMIPVVWIVAALLLARPLIPCRSAPNLEVDPDALLVCAGDSLTAGVDPNTDSQTYVARLRARFGCKVINAGASNDTTGDLLGRFERDVLSYNPTAVLVFIGGNDYLYGVPRKRFAEQLEAIAAQIESAGASAVIVEVPIGIVWNPYAGVYRKVAARHGAILVPESRLRWWLSMELLARDWLTDPLTVDGIHLSPAGATAVARWLEPYLVAALTRKR